MKDINNNLSMEDRMLKLIGVLVIFMCLVTGCGMKSQLCSVQEAEGSRICYVSEKFNVDPVYMSQSLLAVNFIALKKNSYTSEKAYDFINNLKKKIEDLRAGDDKWTFKKAIDYIDKNIKELPDEIQLAFITFPELYNLADIELGQPITDYDFYLILLHLEKQQKMIKMLKN
jgi:hypothetical protein